MKNTVAENETVVLIDTQLKKYILNTADKTDKYKGIGVFDPTLLIGKKVGTPLSIGSKEFWILRPSLMDKLTTIKRRAQIILPRDAGLIIMNCAITSGQTVLEAGIGSGSLTIALASAVQPNGKVISYDIRQDFVDHALKNIKKAQLDRQVSICIHDVTTGIKEKNLDAIILDIPNPWDAVQHTWKALSIGGYFCSFSPLISQVEKTVWELKKRPFIEIRTIENIQRELVVSEKGTRPRYEMLGHTGYLTFARKVNSLKL